MIHSNKLQQLKKFYKGLLTFLVVFFLVDMILGSVIGYFYFSEPNKYVYGIRETKADIIVVGSSRAENHYVPEIFRDSLGMTCFNMGSGGQNIYYDYAIVGSILDRYKPKIFILDLFSIDYEITGDKYSTDNLTILLPFYSASKAVKEVINLSSKNERLKLLSQIYPYNSQVSNILYSIIKKDNNPHLSRNGYIPIQGFIKGEMIKQEPYEFKGIDTLKIHYLEKIISLCKSRNVRIIMITSPWYNILSGSQQSTDLLQNVASKYEIEYWDYSQNSIFLLNGTLFKDIGHLNDDGSRLFTQLIAGRIKNSGIMQ